MRAITKEEIYELQHNLISGVADLVWSDDERENEKNLAYVSGVNDMTDKLLRRLKERENKSEN